MIKRNCCNRIRSKLNRYIDKQLSDLQIREVEEHLLVCTGCKKEYESFVQVNTLMESINSPTPPNTLCDKLKNIPFTNNREVKLLKFKYRLRAVPVAFAILLSVLSALFLSESMLIKSNNNYIIEDFPFAQESFYTLWEEVSYDQ